MFSNDYWRLDDKELELLAIKFHIPPVSRAGESGEHWFIDRSRIIEGLIARDNAMRTKLTTIISAFALLVSIVSICLPLLRKSHHYQFSKNGLILLDTDTGQLTPVTDLLTKQGNRAPVASSAPSNTKDLIDSKQFQRLSRDEQRAVLNYLDKDFRDLPPSEQEKFLDKYVVRLVQPPR